MPGKNLEMLAVAAQQVTHILHAVYSVIVKDRGRLHGVVKAIVGRCVEHYDRQLRACQRPGRFKRGRICQMQRDDGVGAFLLEFFDRRVEFRSDAADGDIDHFDAASLKFVRDKPEERIDAGTHFGHTVVIQLQIQRQQTLFSHGIISCVQNNNITQ